MVLACGSLGVGDGNRTRVASLEGFRCCLWVLRAVGASGSRWRRVSEHVRVTIVLVGSRQVLCEPSECQG
jgi:hypothetical protein